MVLCVGGTCVCVCMLRCVEEGSGAPVNLCRAHVPGSLSLIPRCRVPLRPSPFVCECAHGRVRTSL